MYFFAIVCILMDNQTVFKALGCDVLHIGRHEEDTKVWFFHHFQLVFHAV